MSIWHAIGRQLRRPSGVFGRMAGLSMRVLNAKPNRLAVEALGVTRYDTVLELGFGPGHAIALLVAKAGTGFVYGVDQSGVMLHQARQRNRRSIDAGRVFLYEAPFDRLPFENATVDKVLAVNVIYFWQDMPAILREIRRVLRPNGRLVIYATDAQTMERWKFAGSDTHRLFSAEQLITNFRQAGFQSDEISVESVTVARGITGLLATLANPKGSRAWSRD